MAGLLHAVSWALPFTHAYDALARAASPSSLGGGMAVDVASIGGATIAALSGAKDLLDPRALDVDDPGE
jgi:hypothetical protein